MVLYILIYIYIPKNTYVKLCLRFHQSCQSYLEMKMSILCLFNQAFVTVSLFL